MTRKNVFQNSKTKLLLILLVICTLSMSLFAVACNKEEDKKVNIPNYSYTQTDDEFISNSNFAFGVLDTELTKFPKTSPTGWSKSKDSNSDIGTSSAKSGTINVTEDGWKELLNILYKDSNIIDYIEFKNKADMKIGDTEYTDIKNYVRDFLKERDNKTPTSAEIQSYIIETYFGIFGNPSMHEGANDNFIYMLNNYRSTAYQMIGTSQKITSSSTVTLNKGEYGKVSVWVKTQNLTEKINGEYGANIRVINKFNGTTQSDYAIKNIIAEDWTQYTIYLKADKTFSTSFQLALGLGYGLAGVTEGTAYFDDVVFTHLTEEEFLNETSNLSRFETKLDYNNNDVKFIASEEIQDNTALVYNMALESDYLKALTFATGDISHNPTISAVPGYNGYEGEKSATLTTVNDVDGYNNVQKLELKNMSYTVKFSNSEFAIANGEYAYVEFMLKNQLSNWGSTNISINVYDILDDTSEKRETVATISTVNDEWQKVSLVFKNNFVEEDSERKFEIEFVVGPTDIVSAKYEYDYASGTVYITSPMIASGKIAKYDDNNELTENYNLYTLYSANVSASTALYAGYASDFTDSSDTKTYNFTTAASDIGTITNSVANVKGYQGVEADHYYIKESSTNFEINTRTDGDENGSYAGLINSKYIDKYEINNLKTALNYNGEKAIQPIMIYNATKDNYGFIGNTNTISASSFAKVSVTLRVVDDAVANIYLVNVAEQQKSVLTFDDFDGFIYSKEDTTHYSGSTLKFQLKVDKNMMVNGWATVTFYIATGATEKDFRVEVWNGSRSGFDVDASQGFVFVKDIAVTTSGAFNEPTNINSAFAVANNPLYDEYYINGYKPATEEQVKHQRAWTALEDEFNAKHPNEALENGQGNYAPKIVWVSTDNYIYAVFNTIDPVAVDPDGHTHDHEDASEGCTAETDPSTFWLSFSSIILAVVLVAAIIALFVKNIRRRHKFSKSDAKSHYTVTSRVKSQKKAKKVKSEVLEKESASEDVEIAEDEINEEISEDEAKETTEEKEEVLDDYVYGEVEVFDEEKKDEE